MATCMTVSGIRTLSRSVKSVCVQPSRFRWKPPDKDEEILPSFQERYEEWLARKEPLPSEGVNIGFAFRSSTKKSTNLDRLQKWSTAKKDLEKLARHRNLKIDMDAMKAEWNTESRPAHSNRIASHYGIFSDVFDGATFHPVVNLNVAFDYDEEFVTPAYTGNVIPARETSVEPYVWYESEEDSLWTLVMSSPDGNLEASDKEFLHWMVCNIPGNQLEEGEQVCNYMRPFPVQGAGYLRYVFVLYKQDGRLDLSHLKRKPDCLSLRERTFSTLDFFRQHEDNLTPAGLAFFQSQWDESIRPFFHNVLEMPEPKFELIHPPPFYPEQVAYPHKEPFNLYMDRYRHVKDIQEEVLKEKLKSIDPFSPPKPRPKYVNIDKLPISTPSWLRIKIEDMRLGRNQWKDLYEDSKE